MKQAGYATTIVGKWQLPGTQKQHGFDDYFMWLGGHNLCRKLLTDFDGPVEKEGQSLPGRPARYWHPAIVQNGALVNTTATDYGPALFVEYIKTYMAEHRNDPFFVYFPMCIPHMSWDFEREKAGYLPSPELDASGKPTGRKSSPTLTSNVAYIDYMVGELVAQLERLDLRHNTILLFTCDNGTAGYGKGHVEEERGPRVPMIVNGPGLVKALGERPELIDFSDVLPTLADLAGASLPDDYVHDGHSFAPLLTGKPYVPREWIFSYYAVHRMIRDRRWLQDGNRRFYDCGDRRNEQDYKDVTESNAPEVVAAKARFDSILAGLPPPPEDMRKAWEAKKRAQQTGRRRKKAR
jgi:arylsulfatase A